MNNKTKIITNKYLIDAQTGKAYQGRKDIIGENLKKQSNTTVRSNKSVKPILPYAKGYTPVDVPKVKTPDSKLSPVMRNKTEQFAKELSVFSPAQINDYKNASSWLSDNAKKDAIVWQKNQGWTYGGNPEYEIQPSKDYEYMLDAPDGVYDHMLGEKKYRDAFFSPDGKYISTLPHVHEKYYNLKVSQMSDDEIDKNVEYWGNIKDKADYMYNQTKDEKYKKISEMATYKKKEFSGYIATKKANFTTDKDENFERITKEYVIDTTDINSGKGPVMTKIDFPELNEYAERGKNNKNNPYRDGKRVKAVSGMGNLPAELTDYQKQYINALYGYFDADEAGERAKHFLNQQDNAEMKESLNKNWFGRNIIAPGNAIIANTLGGVATFAEGTYATINNAVSDNQIAVSKNSAGRQMLSTGEAASDVFIGDSQGAGYYVKNALLGVGESVFVSLLTMNPTAALYTMGASAMGREIDSQLDKGNTMGKAYVSGLVSGGIEVATEKIPLDNLFDAFKGGIKGTTKAAAKAGFVKNISKIVAKNGIEEGREEAISNIANVFADMLINGENSDYKTYIKKLMSEEGLTQEEATKEANKKFFLYDTASSAVIGMLSGAFSGGGAYTAGTVVQSAKNYDLKNKFGFNPLNSQKGVMFFDGNVMSEGKTKLNVQNVKNQMSLTKKAQLSNIEASEIVKSHNDMMSKITPQILRNLNYANKLTSGNIIVARGNLDAVNPSLKLDETDAGNSNGYYDVPSNSIVLNFDKIGDAEYIFNSVLTHEMTHSAESSQHYQALSDYVLKDIFGDITTQEGKLALENAQKKKISEYYKKSNGKTKLSFEEAKKEIVAQRMAEMLNNPQSGYSALTELANHDLATARGIVNTIKDTYNKIKDKLTHNEGRYYAKFANYTQYEEAIKLFEKAVRDGAKNRNTNTPNTTKKISYSIETIPGTNMKYVQADRQVITGKNKKQWGKNLENYINDVIRQGKDLVIPTMDGDLLKITEDTAWKIGDKDDITQVKSSAGAHVDEIASISKFSQQSDLNKSRENKRFKAEKFEYRNAYFRDYDGQYYQVRITVGINANEKTVYNIAPPTKRQFPNVPALPQKEALQNGKLSQANDTTANENSQEEFAYKDAEIPNNQFSDAFSKLGIDSIFNSDDNNSSNNKVQNDFTDYSDYRNSDNGNVGLLDRETEGVNKNEAVDNENGAVDKNGTELRKRKANEHYSKSVNLLRSTFESIFRIKELKTDDQINAMIRNVAASRLQNGKVDAEVVNELFEELYSKSEEKAKNIYGRYLDLSNYLIDKNKIFISEEASKEIADFEKLIKGNIGGLEISKTQQDGYIEVNDIYNELLLKFPKFFDTEKIEQADMLKSIIAAAKKMKQIRNEYMSYNGNDADMYKQALRMEFDQTIYRFADRLKTLQQYLTVKSKPRFEIPDIDMSEDDFRNLSKERIEIHNKYERVKQNILLSDEEKFFLEGLITGKITEKDIPKNLNKGGIKKLYNIKMEVDYIDKAFDKYNALKKQNESESNINLDNSDADDEPLEFRTVKADDYYKKAVNTLRKSLSKAFNITNLRNDTRVNEIIKAVTDKHIKNGMVDVKDIDALFEEMYSKGKVINDELYKEYADLRKQLRNTRMFISKEDAGNIADYSDFVKQNMGSFFVSTTKKDGNVEVEAVYNELMEQYPHLFSSEITHPADMLKRIAEVSRSIKKVETELSSYTGEEAEIYKEASKQDFYNAVSAFSDKLNELYKYEKGAKVPVAEVPDVVLKNEVAESNVQTHPYDENKVDKRYIHSVNSEILEKLNNIKNKISSGFKRINLSKVKNNEAERIKSILGIDANDYIHAINTNALNHIEKRHGVNGKHDNSMADPEDVARVEFILDNYDSLEIIKNDNGEIVYSKEFRDKNDRPSPMVMYTKKIDGTYYTVVAAAENKYKKLWVVTAFIGKNKEGITQALNDELSSLSSTPEASLVSLPSTEIITDDFDVVKENTSTTNNRIEMTEDELIGLYNERKELQEKYKKAEDGILLSDKDKHFLEGLISGKITEAEIHPSANIDGIKAVYHLKAQLDFIERSIARYNAIRKEKLNATANSLIEGSDNWKEKRSGLAYGRETMERNIHDMVKDKVSADAIIDEYFTPVHKNEADRTKFKTEFRNRVRELGISRVIKKGDRVSESFAVQFLGELNGDIDYLENKSRLTQTDRIKLEELKAQKERFLGDNKNIKENIDKINHAINEFHKIYDELFVEMNRVRVRNGYAPVEYRHTYFPHFINDEADGILDKMARAIGINMDVTELPTNLAGKTHTFKPGITYFKNTNQRLGNKTVFDAVEGFDKYIEGISDVIYHTDDIQRLRVFENTIVAKYTEDGVKAEIEQLEENNTLDKETLQERYNALKERDLTKFGQFAIELREYTNLLANKKSMHDRHWEGLINRKFYNIATALSRNVSVNMIAGNLSSAFTNFIPLTQAMAGCSKGSIIKAGIETLRSYASDDGIVGMSDFLTNRFGSDKLVKTKAEKFSDILMKPMEFVDNFTSQVIWRAKYLECIDKNMGIEKSVSEANSFAAGLLADRSKGALPTIFSAKNPLAKSLTAFQVEVNNQYSFLFKDLPNATRKKRELAAALMWYFLSAYLFNDLYEKVMGRRPAFDPVGMANEFVGYTTGYKLPNSFETAGNLFKGNKADFHTNKSKTQGGAAMHLAKDVAENLPFVGGLLGGGRIPISSGIPYAEDLTSLEFSKITETISPKTPLNRRLKVIGEEASKLAYGLWPYGGASQILKTIRGIGTARSGGKYTYNSKGEKSLQYPVHNDSTGETVKNYVQAGLFGRNALPTAQDWVRNEFDTLSVKDTERYDLLKEDGVKSKRSYDLVREIAALPDAKYSDKYKHIDNSGILPDAKTDLKVSYLSKDAKEKLEVARRCDIRDATFVEHHYNFNYENVYNKLSEIDQKALSHLKDKKSSAIVQRAYIAKNKALTPEQKLQLDKLLVSEDTKMKAEDYQSMDYFYYSQLTDSQKKRFPAAQKVFDYDARNYYYFLKCTSGVKGKNQKAQKLAKLREAGFSQNAALIWYDIVLK